MHEEAETTTPFRSNEFDRQRECPSQPIDRMSRIDACKIQVCLLRVENVVGEYIGSPASVLLVAERSI